MARRRRESGSCRDLPCSQVRSLAPRSGGTSPPVPRKALDGGRSCGGSVHVGTRFAVSSPRPPDGTVRLPHARSDAERDRASVHHDLRREEIAQRVGSAPRPPSARRSRGRSGSPPPIPPQPCVGGRPEERGRILPRHRQPTDRGAVSGQTSQVVRLCCPSKTSRVFFSNSIELNGLLQRARLFA